MAEILRSCFRSIVLHDGFDVGGHAGVGFHDGELTWEGHLRLLELDREEETCVVLNFPERDR